MKSTEEMESRMKRVYMHEYFLNRIDLAMKKSNYIEAAWLIYSCFENRYFRTLEKYKRQCKYCTGKCKKNRNDLALKTKIDCVKRLYENDVESITKSFRYDLFKETIDWVKERNDLMHDLLSLEYYEETDKRFKDIAEKGKKMLDETYESCTKFRKLFYTDGYIFNFPESAMEKCPCKGKKENEQEKTN